MVQILHATGLVTVRGATPVQIAARPFEYRFRIPLNEPSGTYWYHPHVHGFTDPQVEGGASGALIVRGIERANKFLYEIIERVFVIRDKPLLNPDARPKEPDAQPTTFCVGLMR